MSPGRQETHQHILIVAQKLFAAGGYDATGVAEICLQAGVSKGAFYHHFASKHALFLELLDGWLASLDAGFARAERQADDVPTALRQMADLVAAGIRRPEAQLPMMLEFWAQAQRDPAIWQRAVEPYRKYQAYFEQLIAQGVETGTIRPVPPRVAAIMLTSMAVGLLMQAQFAPDSNEWGEAMRATVELFLEGLAGSQA
ncbi:MAG: TetR/AcrR family transcriptional regulator [Anaerolineales bacterium]|nr:TetR/AcrR family transcriptional regulator [Anaerolineales bacterium]